MRKSPTVSVVIPVWNGERFLRQTLASVREQTFRDWELVVVDDGSRDSSVAIARAVAAEDERVQVRPQANAGVVAARNAGYAATSPNSEFVIFLDHDDAWVPEALAMLVSALRANPDAPAVYGLSKVIDAHGRPLTPSMESSFGYVRAGLHADGKLRTLDRDELTTFDVLAIWPCFQTPGQMLMRRTALEIAKEETGLFDPQARGSDEWELAMRLSLQGGIPRVLEYVLEKRQHDANALDLPGYMAPVHVIRNKLMNAPVYQEQRKTAQHATRASVLVQFSWVAPSLREHKLRLALGQSLRASRAYWRYLSLVRLRPAFGFIARA